MGKLWRAGIKRIGDRLEIEDPGLPPQVGDAASAGGNSLPKRLYWFGKVEIYNVEQTSTAGGYLLAKIDSNRTTTILLNDRISEVVPCEACSTPWLLEHFKNHGSSYDDILVFAFPEGGNACDAAPQRLLGLSKNGAVKLFPFMDRCRGHFPQYKTTTDWPPGPNRGKS